MKTLNRLAKCKQWIIRIVMVRYSTPERFDKVFKEFVIRKDVAIKPLDTDLMNKYGNDIKEDIDKLAILGFVATRTYLDGRKRACITKTGRDMFKAIY